ncbi:integrase/recombinase XerD [Dethiosulfatibacter aminovorans DSM 17477]|uniref:Integrase/recombinase XerD n=1 Tax=Dethiosulfatibacter aminovorans DSM 17477 TaxID=1121476 RepID=A0A1M6GFW3_9FIRM|nr:site-specific tyrosine recombinase/integron integrase [Dethiosulfatibacter aminovorans]SHJ08798.1 integrase/recombinase XerD [Dethiosulfatibacter aminovorans DSM 17477]
MQNQIYNVLNDMAEYLSISQMKKLQEVLIIRLEEYDEDIESIENKDYVEMFLSAKQIEGCSERTISYYQATLFNMFKEIELPIRRITTEAIREYLKKYQAKNNCSKVTIDNVRRNLSSFFSWLEEENYIIKNPVRRIHKVKIGMTVKEVISDENIEIMRDGCNTIRDLAMIDLLFSTGIRVGELVNLDISDVNFDERECIVYGKGDRERKVYFDAKTKLHVQNYLKERCDENRALFVTLNRPYERLKINGVEIRLRELGRKLGIERVHPHKFRRTMATRAIDKGMPIEQVQKLLGHQQIDTTMRYAMVNQNNVKNSHKKYIG